MRMEGLMEEESEGSVLSVLTLGDGDFTFSLDLARWLLKGNQSHRAHLIATGIDTLSELTAKYKDTPSILKRLRNCGSPNHKDDDATNNKLLSVTVIHGVNAVDGTGPEQNQQCRADVVIFNHPHLGVEDTQLHRLFLCHLFYAVQRRWLNDPNGVFHLTLVHGQFERWDCHAAARRHGLVLVAETPFAAPDVENPSYELRRHQSGKSFKSRRSGGRSTIYTFRRACECPADGANVGSARSTHPLWIFSNPSEKRGTQTFPCVICEKTFQEKRSLRNHVLSKHPDNESLSKKKRKREMDDAERDLACQLCFELGVERSFTCSQALEDHIQAKHSALHQYIPANWRGDRRVSSREFSDPAHAQPLEAEEERSYGSCDVCGYVFRSRDGRVEHERMFLPAMVSLLDAGESSTSGGAAATMYSCSFCCKAFRESRAQLQHENRCSLARSPSRTSSRTVGENSRSPVRTSTGESNQT